MWKPSDNSNIENPDNYIATIERAKDDLNKINLEILEAKERRESIIDGSLALLKDKLADIDSNREEIEKLLTFNREIKAKNIEMSLDLENQNKKLSKDMEYFNVNKNSHADFVRNKEEEFIRREQEIREMDSKVAEKQNTLNESIKINNDILENISNKENFVNKNLDEAVSIKKQNQDILESINKEHDLIKQLKIDAEKLNAESASNFSRESSINEESVQNKIDSEKNLSITLKEKESIKDLIIESKKVKLEASNLSEIAKKDIAEANQKIAELKELREAMAKQEK